MKFQNISYNIYIYVKRDTYLQILKYLRYVYIPYIYTYVLYKFICIGLKRSSRPLTGLIRERAVIHKEFKVRTPLA